MSAKNEMKARLESQANLVNLITQICATYTLDQRNKVNLINIKAFLAPLDVDSLVKAGGSIEEINARIVKMYGQVLMAPVRSIADDIKSTREFLVKTFRSTDGDGGPAHPLDSGEGFASGGEATASENAAPSSAVPSGLLGMPMAQRLETVKYLNYESLLRDEYIIVDSRYQNKVNTDPTKMIFALLSNTKSKSDHGGVIIGNTIQDIVEIEVFDFTIPYKPVYVTFYNKITLTVNEWVTNSFEAYEGGQFHFGFIIDRVDNNLIYLTPINRTYRFSKPVNYIDNFSLSFGAVFPKISLDPDRMTPRMSYDHPLGLVTFDADHGLVTGDLVYVTGFSTPAPAADHALITEINRLKGHTIVKKDTRCILLNVDLTAARHEDPPGSGIYPIDNFEQSQATVYFASKRIQVQMRLRYLTNDPTAG